MILHFRDSAGQPRDRAPRSRRGPEENAADFGPLIFFGEVVFTLGSRSGRLRRIRNGEEAKNEKKKMALWGVYYDTPLGLTWVTKGQNRHLHPSNPHG